MIVRISNAYQFPSNFTNPDALYSNDMNNELFANLKRGSLNVYIWMDMFTDSIDFLKSKLEYPYNPWKKYFTTSLNKIQATERTGGRIFGYILTREYGKYSFEVKYVGSIELWISPDTLPSNAVKCKSTIIEEVRYFYAYLKSEMKQYIEFIYASEQAGVIEVRWKRQSTDYKYIDSDCLFPFVNDTVRIVPETYNPLPLPLHTPSSWLIDQFHPFDERNTLFSIPPIDLSQFGTSSVFASCDYKPAIPRIDAALKLIRSYPAKTLHSTLFRKADQIVFNAVIGKKLKENIIGLFIESISGAYPAVHLSRLMNMERLHDNDNGDLYLIEVMVTFALNSSKEYLLSHYVVLGHKDYPQSQFCHPTNMKIRRDKFVHILVTHRNLPQMLREFVQNMEQVYDETGDENFGVIIVNYVIPQFNVTTLLRQSRLKH
ncbi:Beta-1,4-N-acetylgalactosaminyltransferase 3 [Oopsacas minuta]|uniref:Beta-1,4-N-acetylgalactosaminyltransferase 3 n=1 Tax=Oopsacas minuta TaxID=111878 RepID=A0AAV7KFQ6_9METZ|nr:Beta-1,4-N-acetylgalactosaminyltransferase 3 [Oopsacas minuta]